MKDIQEMIKEDIENNPVILFMKGTKLMPMCGFSATVVEILDRLEIPYETRNVLENDDLRQGIKEYSDWPTIPQLYINQEFIGGCDIAIAMYESGELKDKLSFLVNQT